MERNSYLMSILSKQENELKTQDAQMAVIINSMNEKESVISELESKIRNLENDTPKSSPAEMYGNGDARKNLSEPKRNSSMGFIMEKPPKAKRKPSTAKSLKDLSTRSLPSTPVIKKEDPMAVARNQMIDYDEISERIQDLETANSNLLDDNRTLSVGFMEKSKSHDELVDRLAELTKELVDLKKQQSKLGTEYQLTCSINSLNVIA